MFRNAFYLVAVSMFLLGNLSVAQQQGGGGPVLWSTCITHPAWAGGRGLHCTSPGFICVNHDDSCEVNGMVVFTDKALFAEMAYDACEPHTTLSCTQGPVETCMAVGLFVDDCLGAEICIKARTVIGC